MRLIIKSWIRICKTEALGGCGWPGKFNKHIDYWDAINNQEYFSLEAFQHVLSQMFSFQKTPDIPTPSFVVLKKTKNYEIRRCNGEQQA